MAGVARSQSSKQELVEAYEQERFNPAASALREWLLAGIDSRISNRKRRPRVVRHRAVRNPMTCLVDPVLLDAWQELVWLHGHHELVHELDYDVHRWRESGLTWTAAKQWLEAGADVQRPYTAALLAKCGVGPADAFQVLQRSDSTRSTIFSLVASRELTVEEAKRALVATVQRQTSGPSFMTGGAGARHLTGCPARIKDALF